MSKIREKESLECGRMHIWALKTQKLPGPLSGPWTPAANCSLRSRNSASLCRQLSASAPGAPPLTKSWIRTWYTNSTRNFNCYIQHNFITCVISWAFKSITSCNEYKLMVKYWYSQTCLTEPLYCMIVCIFSAVWFVFIVILCIYVIQL